MKWFPLYSVAGARGWAKDKSYSSSWWGFSDSKNSNKLSLSWRHILKTLTSFPNKILSTPYSFSNISHLSSIASKRKHSSTYLPSTSTNPNSCSESLRNLCLIGWAPKKSMICYIKKSKKLRSPTKSLITKITCLMGSSFKLLKNKDFNKNYQKSSMVVFAASAQVGSILRISYITSSLPQLSTLH